MLRHYSNPDRLDLIVWDKPPTGWRWQWYRFLAYFRLSKRAVCVMSHDDERDYHDYPDSTLPVPWHFYNHTCKRCGKEFTI